MNEFVAPGYTFEEACEILAVRQSDLKQLVLAGGVHPVVFTKPRQMLLFYPSNGDIKYDPNGVGRVGLGTFEYRGHLQLDSLAIQSLLDGDVITTGKVGLKILEVDGVSLWNSSYPYTHSLPIDNITHWAGTKFPRELASHLMAIPLPVEIYSGLSILKKLSAQARSFQDGTISEIDVLSIVNPDPEDMMLDYEEPSSFQPEDLRIAKSELDRQAAVSALTSGKGRSVSSSAGENSSRRENQLHALIERVLEAKPEISTKEIWKAIERESNLEDRIFDCDFILQNVDADEIHWRSRYKKDQYLKYTSFPTTVGKIRTKMAQPQ